MAMLVLLMLSVQAFAQNSAITGLITDPSGGVIQGAKVTATNEGTNAKQEVTTSNAGVYNLNLQSGKYTISVDAQNFATQSRREVDLSSGSQLRINFQMQVKEQSVVLDVNVQNENLILESGSTGATVLTEDQISKLPLYNNNVLDLVKLMGGVEYAASQIFSSDSNTISGLTADKINVTKDGISASEIRWPTGFNTPVNLNPDLVGEFKVVMQPVDAELGHGAGQIQVVTRSGANAFRGSANWNIGNSALNSNQWSANKTVPKTWPQWSNRQNVSVNLGGPIIKNKTFFFVLFEWNSNMSKDNNQTVAMPTACAKKGIYRYYEGYVSQVFGAAAAADPTVANITGATARASYTLSRQVVTWDGKPLNNLHAPYYLGGTYTGRGTDLVDRWATPDATHADRMSKLMAFSPFGVIKKALPYLGGTGTWDPATDINCEQVQVVTDKNSAQYGFPTSDWVDYTGTWNTSGVAMPIADNAIKGTRSSWDYYRHPDTSGYVQKLMDLTTAPNIYSTGDGLNWGGYRWTRRNNGVDNIYGIGEGPNRKQINVRIDHNINTRNRLSGSYTYEKDKSDDAMKTTPTNSYGGKLVRLPSTLSATLTTTVKPNFLNEVRVGFTRSNSYTYSPLGNPDTGSELKKLLYNMLPTGDWTGFQNIKNQDIPVIVALYNFGISSSNYNPYGGGRNAMSNDWGSTDMRWSYTDTVTLTVGRHSLRFGGETQRLGSNYKTTGPANYAASSVYPYIAGGTPGAPLTNVAINGFYTAATNTWTLPGTVGNAGTGGNMGGITNLLQLMSGSVASVSQYFFINKPTDTKYNQVTDGDIWRRQNFHQNNFDFFLQDNWRVTDDLTLNLGLRYEWYGVPYNADGMTGGLVGGAGAAMGLSGRNLVHWLNLNYNPQVSPVADAYKNCTDKSGAAVACSLTQYAFIGPDSPNPDVKFYNNDWNNFGPVFGFAYSLPWGGKGKTVLRGGIQISYTSFGRSTSSLPDIPGISQTYSDTNGGAYMDLSMMKNKIPISLPTSIVPPAVSATVPPPVDYHQGTLTVYDPNVRTPYTEGLNLSLTRSIGSNVTLELRYSGSLSHKQTSQINLNSVNFLSTGLIPAFMQARAGGNPELLNRVLKGVNIAGATSTNTATTWGRIGVDINPRTGQVFQAGDELRGSTLTCTTVFWAWTPGACLASGYYGALANWMATANLNTAWNPGVPNLSTSVSRGQMLRVAGMPDNYLTANPQFGTVNWTGNFNDANYHSGQAQLTLRPTHGLGLSFQFTWSKSFGMGSPADFSNRDLEYRLQSASKSIQSYGTFDLPFGPNRWLLSNFSPNILGRVIGGWQLSWIHTYSTGSLLNVTSNYPYLWGGSNPALQMAPFDKKSGSVEWAPGAAQGNYFGGKYGYVMDPQCSNSSITEYRGAVTAAYPNAQPVTPEHPNLQASCNMYATTVSSTGQIIFANPVAGIRGNYSLNQIPGMATWNTDGAMSKTFRLTEGKSLQLRVDASNVFNHVQPGAPDMNIGIGFANFGGITSKSGQRKFQARIRVDF
jgi:hypothetical protein